MNKKRLIYGVGVNDAGYTVKNQSDYYDEEGKRHRKLIWQCPYYLKWKNMLTRCYSDEYHRKEPVYKDCEVCEEWLTFSNFKAWMETQDWKDKQLDKDLLVKNNKIYSPETCMFVSAKLNNFLHDNNHKRGLYPIGVILDFDCTKYRATMSFKGKTKLLGYFNTALEAHEAWKIGKMSAAIDLKREQSDMMSIQILDSFIKVLEDSIQSGEEFCYD